MSIAGRRAAAIVADFYEGVLAPEAWQHGLDGLCSLSGSMYAAVTTWDRRSDCATVRESVGLTDACRRQFVDHYCMLDPARAYIDRISSGNWYIDHRDVGLDVMSRSAFYQDFLRQFGLGSVIATPLTRDRECHGFLVLQYALGQYLQHVPPELSSVLPHLRRSLKLQQRFQAVTAQSSLAKSILMQLHVPLLVLDRNAHIILANGAAERALDRNSALRTIAGKLVLADAKTRAFANLLAGACSGMPRIAGAMLLPSTSKLPVLQVLVAPLPQWHSDCQDATTPLALVLLHDNASSRTPQRDFLQQLYALTPAEVRIALAVFNGTTPRAYAAASGVSLATVRTQLSAVLHKTETARQSDLVHLLSTLALLGT